MKKIFSLALLLLIFINFISYVYSHRGNYLWRFDPDYWQKRYEESQWVKGFGAENKIGDEELYVYAGWRQIKGDDPTKVEATVPPFGKYLIGISIVLFNNPVVISPLLGLFTILIFYFLSKRILNDQTFSLLAVALFTLEPIFKENLSSSMLDLPLVLFVIMTFYFLSKGRSSPKWYLFTIVCLALVSVTKMYLLGFGLTLVVAGFLLLYSISNKSKDFLYFLACSPAFIGVYGLTYFKFFLNGQSLADFKYYHFWVRHFARVQVTDYPKGEILRILFLGRWKTWWEGSSIIKVEQWNILWPLATVFLVLTSYLFIKEKNWNLLLLIIWPVSLLGMFFIGVPYPRYLLPVLPGLYLGFVYNLKYWGQKAFPRLRLLGKI